MDRSDEPPYDPEFGPEVYEGAGADGADDPDGFTADYQATQLDTEPDAASDHRDSGQTANPRGSDARGAGLPFLWVRDFGDLMKPPKLKWLFRDLRTGQPFIRAGKCYAVSADGGVGKGFLALQTAVSIATGLDLFGSFKVEQRGRVALLVGEDDQAEVHHRLCRIANSLGLSDLNPIRERIGVFPLTGLQVDLLERDECRNPQRTAVFVTLLEQLTRAAKDGDFEWSLVSIDPLSRFGGPDVETDQNVATTFVAALEHLAEQIPGQPAVHVSHHSSAESVRFGKSNMRGVTGLRNAFRCVLALEAVTADGGLRGILLRHDKTNLSPQAPPLWLVRETNEPMGSGRYIEKAGVLRLATDEETATLAAAAGATGNTREERQQATQTRKREAFDAECAAVLQLLPPAPEHITLSSMLTALRAAGTPRGDKTVNGILEHLVDKGLVVDLSTGGQGKARRWARTTQ